VTTAAGTGRARRSRWQEFLRFAAFGVVNTLSYYASFLVLVRLMPYLAAHALAYTASMTGSFFLNCRYTFHVRPTWGRYVRFPLAGASTFVVMTVGVTLLVQGAGTNPEIASLASALLAVPISYVLSRLLLVDVGGNRGGEATPGGRRVRFRRRGKDGEQEHRVGERTGVEHGGQEPDRGPLHGAADRGAPFEVDSVPQAPAGQRRQGAAEGHA
jgi:putative flippase GtrA